MLANEATWIIQVDRTIFSTSKW